MTAWTLIFRSLFFYRRSHFAVALGVAAATAVLTGALLVGDSVRSSLRHLTLDRLGQIDEVLVTDRFFRAQLADELSQSKAFQEHYRALAPAVLFPSVTLETRSDKQTHRAANVLALGCDERFWKLGSVMPDKIPGTDEIVLNAPLAAALQAQVGDEIILRLPSVNQVPADSPLGRKNDRIQSVTGLKVVAIVPAESLGRFALRPSQAEPWNAYVAPSTLQSALQQDDKVNMLLIAGNDPHTPPGDKASAALASALAPTLEDFGLRIDRIRRTFTPKESNEEQLVYDYYHVSTDRMIFSPESSAVISKALAEYHPQPLLTYLANTIAKQGEKEGVPYSTITAIDSVPVIGPLLNDAAAPIQLADDEIALNSWTAEDLKVNLGDSIRIAYFSPETTHGQAIETSATFKLKFIAPLTEPAAGFNRDRPAIYHAPPTLVNDPDLTPIVEGITDQDSIAKWDPPFPFDRKRVRIVEDDNYWQNHRTTPKAFLSLAAGQKLWGSRFGNVTSFRIPATADINEELLRNKLLTALRADKAELGFTLLPVKQQGLDASNGSTPFDVLFLFLSFFIIASALMLVAVLFKLGVQQRVTEVGTLLAMGWRGSQATWSLLREGLCVSLIGAALGVVLGIGYAWLMLAGLRTWWVGAITTPFLQFDWTTRSLLIGFISGVIVSLLTIYLSLRQLRSLSTRQLLAGQLVNDKALKSRSRLWNIVALALVFVAVGLAGLATTLGGEAQAGAFVGGGAAVLTALLLAAWNYLRVPRRATLASAGKLSLGRLAIGAAQRNPSRSTLTMGLVAAASFLIIAMSSFRLDPSKSGAGGFDLVATTSQPIFVDLNDATVRDDLFHDNAQKLKEATILGLRYRAGDDASCNNLYQAAQPRVIGITPALIKHYDGEHTTPFEFAASSAQSPEQKHNPWRVLSGPPTPSGDAIPVVLDKNTAMYSLHLYRGIGEEFDVTYEDHTKLTFRVVGLLSNSILQGSLAMSEADFVKYFPAISGYRYFLVQGPAAELDEINSVMSERLNEEGFAAQSTVKLLTALLAVQNTYLSTFQSLGALGLLLGTFGLATVQLRSVIERRSELALLQAAGFARSRVAQLVLIESVWLLLGGLGAGVLAALVAVLPHILLGGARIRLDELAIMLGIVLAVGLVSSLIAVRATMKADIIAALRGE